MKTSWIKSEGRRTDYIDVHYNEVVVGYNYGTGMTDNAGACTHKEFLGGRFNGLILERFGQNILSEVIATVKASPNLEEHNKKRAKIKKIKDYIYSIPIDKSLRNLIKNQKTINGFLIYGNQGHYKSFIESDTTTLFYKSTKATITNKVDNKKFEIEFSFHASSCVELNDYYYIIGNDNLHVLSPQGIFVFTTENVIEEKLFGYEVRISNVFRYDTTIFFSYWAFDDEFIPKGLIRYELGEGLTGRVEVHD